MSGIGVFGGTFDPIHYGHLRSAWEVAESLALDSMQFVPSNVPVHRASPQATVEQRLTMVHLAIESMPNWSVNACEIHRGGPSYTVETIERLREEVGHEIPLWLILGSDAFEGFVCWHRWQDILALANVAVMYRAGVPPVGCVQTQALLKPMLPLVPDQHAGQIQLVPVTALAISATAIRDGLHQGHLPHFLVPPSVLTYILQHALYQGSR